MFILLVFCVFSFRLDLPLPCRSRREKRLAPLHRSSQSQQRERGFIGGFMFILLVFCVFSFRRLDLPLPCRSRREKRLPHQDQQDAPQRPASLSCLLVGLVFLGWCSGCGVCGCGLLCGQRGVWVDRAAVGRVATS